MLPLVLAWRGRRGALDPTCLWLIAPCLTYLLGGFGRITGQAAIWEGLKQAPPDKLVEASHQALPLTMIPELAAAGSLVFVFVGMILLAAALLLYRRRQPEIGETLDRSLLWLIAALAFYVVLATWRFLALQSRIWVHDAFVAEDPAVRVEQVEVALRLEAQIQLGGGMALLVMLGMGGFLLHRARVLWPLRRTKNAVISLVMLIAVLGMADIADRRDLAFGLDHRPAAAARLGAESPEGQKPHDPGHGAPQP